MQSASLLPFSIYSLLHTYEVLCVEASILPVLSQSYEQRRAGFLTLSGRNLLCVMCTQQIQLGWRRTLTGRNKDARMQSSTQVAIIACLVGLSFVPVFPNYPAGNFHVY